MNKSIKSQQQDELCKGNKNYYIKNEGNNNDNGEYNGEYEDDDESILLASVEQNQLRQSNKNK